MFRRHGFFIFTIFQKKGMQKNIFPLLIGCTLLLVSCEFQCSVGGDKKSKNETVTNSVREENGVVITNNINIKAAGIKLKSAVLKLPNGERVPDDNVVGLGEKINLIITLDSNWAIEKGKTFIGASEKITTDDGTVVLNAGDLFLEYDENGVDPMDAKIIRLNAVITKPATAVKYFKVDFRVWDKKGTAEVTGDYKFYVKK
jgi:hypothetical protein